MRHTSISFFNFILMIFGDVPVKFMKLWINYQMSIRNRVRIKFIKFCIHNDIVPQHLQFIHNSKLNFSHFSVMSKFKHLKYIFILRLLKMELNDAFRSINHSQREILHLVRKISLHILTHITESFFAKQRQYLGSVNNYEFDKIDKKICWLLLK